MINKVPFKKPGKFRLESQVRLLFYCSEPRPRNLMFTCVWAGVRRSVWGEGEEERKLNTSILILCMHGWGLQKVLDLKQMCLTYERRRKCKDTVLLSKGNKSEQVCPVYLSSRVKSKPSVSLVLALSQSNLACWPNITHRMSNSVQSNEPLCSVGIECNRERYVFSQSIPPACAASSRNLNRSQTQYHSEMAGLY